MAPLSSGLPTPVGVGRAARLAGAAALALVLAVAVAVAFGPSTRAGAAPTYRNTMTHPAADHAGWSLAGRQHVRPAAMSPADSVQGLDVSGYQGNVDWNGVAANGGRFAFVKATEGTGYTNPYFAQQYVGSYDAGLVRGAYHFGLPDNSSGAAQADYLADNGGAWSADGQTLPAALDIEYNPYGGECYGLDAGGMVGWISDFVNEYHNRTGRWAVIYTTFDWWSTCTGNSDAFAGNDPMWVANYNGSPGALPAGYDFWTFWQYAGSGTFPGDQDVFNGAADRLTALANNT